MKVRTSSLSPFTARGIAIVCASIFVISAHPAHADVNVWTSYGPGAPRFETVVLDPNSGALYAAVFSGSVFKSTDAGDSWSAASADLPTLGVLGPLAVDPSMPGTLYAGTLENGVFKSTDGAINWQAPNTGVPLSGVVALAIDPVTPSTLYAGTVGIGGPAGVFKSTDAGVTWSTASTGLPDTGNSSLVNALAVDPATPGTLYAAMGVDNVSGGVFKSTDGGASWSAARTGLPDTYGVYVRALAIDSTTPATLYAGTGGDGLFKSTNAGGTWSASNGGGCHRPDETCRVLSGTFILSLAVDPTTPATLYAGSNGGVFKTTDAGATWRDGNLGLSGQAITSLAVDRTTPGTLYIGGYDGAFKSTDGAGSWNATANTGLPGTAAVSALAVDPTTPGTLYAGGGGVFKSTDGGATWGAPNAGLTSAVTLLALDPNAPTTLYAVINGGVFKSTDAGGTWTGPLNSASLLAVDFTPPATLYAGTIVCAKNTCQPGVSRSADGGQSWSPVTGLPGTDFHTLLKALAVDPAAPATLYAGTITIVCPFTGGEGEECSTTVQVFKSINAGDSWSTAGTGLPATVAVNGFAFDPTAPGTLYARTEAGEVFKSADGGGNWNAVNFPGLPVFDLTAPNVLYTSNGDVLKSTDAGATWSSMGLTAVSTVLALDPTTPGRLYAGTNGGGVFDIEQVATAKVVGTGTAASCTDAALNAALAGGGLVTFDCGADPVTIDISTGTGVKMITADTIIDGGGLITISGGNTAQVFWVFSELAVHNLTIANANGGISNVGTLAVTNSAFSGNTSQNSPGGAITNRGTLAITNSTFSGNSSHLGGAIYSERTATVTNCTFSSNSAEAGGAIYGFGLTVTNSTFSGNTAIGIANSDLDGGAGGAIYGGMVTVTNSTFSRNSASFIGGADGRGGNIFGSALVRNTIVANSLSGDNCTGGPLDVPAFLEQITDGGHNLDDGTSCGFSTANGSLSDTDPQLDPAGLQANRGPTETVALCTDVDVPAGCTAASPAIDAGDQAVCTAAPVNNRDQRGFVRPGTGHTDCSMGAYEADATEPCTGDCDGNGMEAINELILGVNIALGLQPLATCPAFANAQGMVDIAQLIKGVNNSLDGCGG